MKKSIYTILPMALLASCSSELMETADNAVNGGDVEKVSIVSHPFVFDDDTRTSLTATYKGISFAWANYDALGVFPIAPTTNNQARQALSVPADCETNAHYASFDGAGWELKKGNTYAAYCPYNGSLPAETPYTEVPIDMTGQDGTLETIGKKYDYMYAPSSFAEEKVNGHTHEVVFDFQHAIAILQLKLTMPVAATWKSLTLLSNTSGLFVTYATMNVQDGTVTTKVKSPDITLTLKNVTTTASNKDITLYVAVLPKRFGKLSLTATTSNNESYCASVGGRTLTAGKAFRFTTSFNTTALPPSDGYENGHAYVDLNLPSGLKWATMNVGAADAMCVGKYYAWGETKACGEEDFSNDMNYNYNSNGSYTKFYYDGDTYKWWNNSSGYTKYITTYDVSDNKVTLDSEDDAAARNWGGAWRMPTHKEQEELVNNCYWEWTTNYNGYGLAGFIVYAAKSSSDKGVIIDEEGETPLSDYSLFDSHIFIPAAGYHWTYDLWNTSWVGSYWSSSLHEKYNEGAWNMRIGRSRWLGTNSNDNRPKGCSIRAVCE